MTEAYRRTTRWKQWYEVREITEEGVYAEGQVPDSYGGSKLTVEVVQRIVFTDSAGHLVELRMDDITGVKDADDLTGLEVNVYKEDGTIGETIAATSASTAKIKWLYRAATGTPPAVEAKAAFVQGLFDDQYAEENP